eukprot:c21922_g1_i1 orf=928-1410(-)
MVWEVVAPADSFISAVGRTTSMAVLCWQLCSLFDSAWKLSALSSMHQAQNAKPSSLRLSSSNIYFGQERQKRHSKLHMESMFAASDENSSLENSAENETSSSPGIDKKVQARAAREKGQTTAIITGTIAILLGVAYLLLIQLLDTRGINLVLPPPEAFEP